MRSRSPKVWFFLFSLLYFSQGAVMAYITNFQKPYLSSVGVLPAQLGLFTSLLLLPFVLKIVFGLMSDRFPIAHWGHRKPYIVLGLVLASLGFLAAVNVDPSTHFFEFGCCIFAASVGVALFDACTDGLAIDTVRPEDHGTAQAFMVGGRALGVVLLSFVFSRFDLGSGYSSVFLTLAALLLFPLAIVLLLEVPTDTPTTMMDARFSKSLFLDPKLLWFMGYAMIYSALLFGVDGLITLQMTKTFQAPPSTLGEFGALRGLGSVCGAVLSGWIIVKKGKFFAARLAVVLMVVGALGLSLLPSVESFRLWAPIWGLAWGFQETLYVAVAMGFCPPHMAAAVFAAYMALSNLGTALGDGVATSLTGHFSISILFVAGALGMATLPLFLAQMKDRLKSPQSAKTSESTSIADS